MKFSQQALNKLKEFEGFRSKAYKAVSSETYWTIGYGHYGADVNPDDVWSEEKATQVLMNQDLPAFENYVNANFSGLNQHQFDALVDFAYNCGNGNLGKSTLAKRVKANKNDKSIREAFMMWNKAGGKVLAGLTKRRTWEADWYFAETPTSEMEEPNVPEDVKPEEKPNDVIANTMNNTNGTEGNSSSNQKTYIFNGPYSTSASLPPKIIQAIKPKIVVDDMVSDLPQ